MIEIAENNQQIVLADNSFITIKDVSIEQVSIDNELNLFSKEIFTDKLFINRELNIAIVKQDIELVEIGTQGPPGAPGSNVIELSDTIPALSSKVVDISSGIIYAQYHIEVFNTANTVYTKRTICITLDGAGSLVDSVYMKLGQSINFGINANLSGGNIELTIQNNQNYDLTFRAIKHAL